MEQKVVRYYDILFDLAGAGYGKKPKAVEEAFGRLAELDAGRIPELWEYLLLRDGAAAEGTALKDTLTTGVFKLYYALNPARALRTVTENRVLRKALFEESALALSPELLEHAASLIRGGKLAAAGDIVRHAQRNAVMGKTFGEYMLAVFDRIKKQSMRESGKKLAALKRAEVRFLLAEANKIKGPEKHLLIQRVNELLEHKEEDISELIMGRQPLEEE